MSAPFLPFQKVNVFVNGRSAQITNSCQFADVEVSALVGGIMQEEDCGNAVFGCLRSAALLVLGLSVRHPRPHTGADGYPSLPGLSIFLCMKTMHHPEDPFLLVIL